MYYQVIVSFSSSYLSPDSSLKAGIGTYNAPEIASPIAAKLSRIVDSMIGVHLDAHVMGK